MVDRQRDRHILIAITHNKIPHKSKILKYNTEEKNTYCQNSSSDVIASLAFTSPVTILVML